MRRYLLGLGFFFAIGWAALAQKEEIAPTPSELKKSTEGWTDLFAKDLPGWKRVPIPATGKLAEKNPWALDRDTLRCEGTGVHEMLLWDKELTDGVFHVEWKFPKKTDKKGYTSGLYIRSSSDGSVWHQVQLGDQNIGYLFGETLVNGAKKRFKSETLGRQRGYPAGEWNTTEVTAAGKAITLWHNGYVTSKWTDCTVARGHIALEAEGCVIEFRNAKWKESK